MFIRVAYVLLVLLDISDVVGGIDGTLFHKPWKLVKVEPKL